MRMTITSKATTVAPIGLFTVFAALAAKVVAIFDAEVPMGYEDETGFHTGIKPRDHDTALPPGLVARH